MTATSKTDGRITISIDRVERPLALAGKYQLSFHMDEQHAVSVHLTQGELLDLWQKIGVTFNLLGMGDEFRRRNGEQG